VFFQFENKHIFMIEMLKRVKTTNRHWKVQLDFWNIILIEYIDYKRYFVLRQSLHSWKMFTFRIFDF